MKKSVFLIEYKWVKAPFRQGEETGVVFRYKEWKHMLLRRGGVDMATQIAPTPVVKGIAAVKIYEEANQKRSQASRYGAQLLKNKFDGRLR